MTKISLKTSELRAMFETASSLAVDQATGQHRKWPVKVSYWIARLITKMQSEYEASEKLRLELAEQFGTKTEDGKLFEFTAGAAQQFNESMTSVNDTVIDIELPAIGITAFDDLDIEPTVFIVFGKLVVEPLELEQLAAWAGSPS